MLSHPHVNNPLKIELRKYDEQLKDFLAQGHEGEHVVIHGNRVLNFFPTFEAAFDAAQEEFGDSYFLVREIVRKEVPHYLPICIPSNATAVPFRRD